LLFQPYSGCEYRVNKSRLPKTFIYKFLWIPLSIAGLKVLDVLLILIGIIVLIDAIQGIFTEESIIPKIKEELVDLFEN
jgi:hypothetical protein